MPRLASITTQTLAGLALSRGIASLTNGDFETGDFTGWSATGFTTQEVNSGIARLSSTSTGILQQGLSVVPNATYVLALDIISSTAAGVINVSVSSATDGTIVSENLNGTVGLQVYAFSTQDNALTFDITVQSSAILEIDSVDIALINTYFAHEYPLTNTSVNPTSATWQTSFAPTTTFFFPNVGIYSQSPIVDATQMFQSNTTFNDADITSWDTGTFEITDSMFEGATAFNQDISSWDVSEVTDTSSMFANATNFNQDIGSWDTSSVTLLNNMFNNADAFDQDISSWDTDAVTSATDFSAGAQQKTLGNWTDLEHPRIAIRSTAGTALSSFGSSTTSVTLEGEATDLPPFPFRIYGERTGTIAEVNSTSVAGFGETILNFSSSVPNTWEFGERVTIILSSV
jgi:surface protein